MPHRDSLVRTRQDSLRARYLDAPRDAWITDHAYTTGGTELDAVHGRVVPGSVDHGITWPFGIHRAVGGNHDLPNPGDLLAAALAACLDSTIRMIADRLGVTFEVLEVAVKAELDVRGTLVVDREVPVGFQRMTCSVRVRPTKGTDPKALQKILAAAEYSCVNLQTLRNGVSVKTHLETGD
jgi:uncharacterized OsmC-like protein